jgi:hypothetical protein
MDKPLSAETQSQILVLCESIAQRDQLGEDVQEELRGHVEDKIVAYLEGREAITEPDAVILAQKHFGDPLTVKTLLHTVHPGQRYVSLGRRIAVVLLVTLVVQVATRIVLDLITPAIAPLLSSQAAYIAWRFFRGSLHAIGVPFGAYCLLKRSRANSNRGIANWFVSASNFRVQIVAAAILTFWILQPDTWGLMWIMQFMPKPDVAHIAEPLGYAVMALDFAMHLGGSALLCVVWVWWCDQAPRTLANIRVAAAVWLSWELFVRTFVSFAQMALSLHIQKTFFGGGLPSSITWQTYFRQTMLHGYNIAILAMIVFIATVTGIVYARMRPPQARQT